MKHQLNTLSAPGKRTWTRVWTTYRIGKPPRLPLRIREVKLSCIPSPIPPIVIVCACLLLGLIRIALLNDMPALLVGDLTPLMGLAATVRLDLLFLKGGRDGVTWVLMVILSGIKPVGVVGRPGMSLGGGDDERLVYCSCWDINPWENSAEYPRVVIVERP